MKIRASIASFLAVAMTAGIVLGPAALSSAGTQQTAAETGFTGVAFTGDDLDSGKTVEGTMDVRRFVVRNGKLKAVTLLDGTVYRRNGSVYDTFTNERRLITVSRVGVDGSGRNTSSAVANAATCEILRLVLGPLDLDLLGLHIHLNRVVLVIEAHTGPGNLLGNLLCAIAGLLDRPNLGPLLGVLRDILNAILEILEGLPA